MAHRRCIALLAGLVALLAPSAAAAAENREEPAPNLVVTKVSKPPASAVAGSKIGVVIKLRNKGTADAGKSRVALYLAKGKKRKAKDPRLRRGKVKALQPGKKAKSNLKVTLPGNTPPGSYRLIACADDTRKVKESKERNCVRTKKFTLLLPPIQGGSPTPAFTMTDGIDWGFRRNSNGARVEAGRPITATLRAGNGIAGDAGYVRSSVAPQPLLGGTTTTLQFNGSQDNNQVTRLLPFAFPFSGVAEQSISVSTNGWVSFGDPALDFWDNTQMDDYRGVDFVVGEFVRGIMPYWADLTVTNEGEGFGRVKEVIAPDGSYVAFQWDVSHNDEVGARRTLQLVLFPDGRFRFDYPGANPPSDQIAFVGFSNGTGRGGGGSAGSVVALEAETVPRGSILYTPNPLALGAPTAAGEAALTLPAGSSVISADPACTVTLAPGPITEGRVSCQMPPLGIGQQAAREITFATPSNAPQEALPANFRYGGTYVAGGSTLTDKDEINPLGNSQPLEELRVELAYLGPNPPKANAIAKFSVGILSPDGPMDEPSLTLQLPADTKLDSIHIADQAIPCTPVEGNRVTCRTPSGSEGSLVIVNLVPSVAAIGSQLRLQASGQAFNGPSKTATVETTATVVP